MRRHLEALDNWLDHRTGIPTAARQFLYESIPASSGWHQVFGSIAVFLFLTQAFTGVLLAFNYAPTPGDAYNSLRYILTELTGGRLIRGLHHWGASMMIVVVVLHMVQVFLWGAYKKPREATWIVGVVLLLLTLAYGLTGYLLPWDNRAYWGTVVATQIAGQAPVAGQYIQRLMGGGGAVGVVTFARFYGLHVLLLPPATLLLIAVHVYLVRKHGVAAAPGDELVPRQQFYPRQVFKDTVAIFIVFAILFTMALVARVPLEQLADPTDTSYTPRPEWYFLFLFQTLKLFTGPLELVGSVVLPGLAVLALILVPFIDRSQMVKVTKRTAAFAFVFLAAITWTGLTLAAVKSTPKEATLVAVDFSAPTDWMQLTPEEMTGVAYFREENCISCHAVGDHGGKVGPDLTRTTVHKDAAWMIQHFKNPGAMRPGTSMPAIQLSDAQLNSLAAFLLKLNPDNASALDNTPEFATAGALIYEANHCATCHAVNGSGAKVGPPLNGLAKRQSRSWVIAHFADPQKLSPGSFMPAYKFSQKDLENITNYLFALP
ncbi:MAG TPA: cytochrome b N-terminal domain-containing protein [Candidatus Limnocylindrales bacterium]|nr:cytochrome b N-terminal domain-containing protein [Candidatus Limnocylindrales bacterium]